MSRVHLLFAAGFLCLLHAPAVAISPESVDQHFDEARAQQPDIDQHLSGLVSKMESISDADYEGGLSPEDLDLVDGFVQQAFARGTESMECPPVPARGGIIIGGRFKDEGNADEREFRNPVFTHLSRYVRDGNRRQRDIAYLALAKIGPGGPIDVEYLKQIGGDSGWARVAYSKIGCDQWGPIDVHRMWSGERQEYLDGMPLKKNRTAAVNIMIDQMLEPNRVFPPEVFSNALSNRGYSDDLELKQVKRLIPLLSISERPISSRLEAMRFVHAYGKDPQVFEDILWETYQAASNELKYEAGNALVEIGSRFAPGVLADWINVGEYGHWLWSATKDCIYTEGSAELESALTGQLQDGYPKARIAAANSLGCIQAKDAIPDLVEMLDEPYWSLQLAAARALGRMPSLPDEAEQALDRIREKHWSSKVREATNAKPLPEEAMKADEEEYPVLTADYFNCWSRCEDEHGLPECHSENEGNGAYRLPWLDNGFDVKWNWAEMGDVPDAFPAVLEEQLAGYRERRGYGSNTVLEVDDGWLYSVDLWHYDGSFVHVNRDGQVSEIHGTGAHAAFLLETDFGITSLGQEILGEGNGLLATLDRNEKGEWFYQLQMELPSEAFGYAFAPDGTLLVKFGEGAAAITTDREIYPLECAE